MKEEHVHIPIVQALQEQENIMVWRMPPTLSQSRLGGRISPSNACTVIAVRMAEVIHRSDTRMPAAGCGKRVAPKERLVPKHCQRAAAGQEEVDNGAICLGGRSAALMSFRTCPPEVISCLTNAILDGNSIHEEAVRQRPNGEQNFTIPDAIRVCKNAVTEIDFCSVPGPLSSELPFYIRTVIKSPLLRQDSRLFFLLIAFERTVLIVFERTTHTLTLFDSHMHGQSDGAVIANGHADNVDDLCHWLSLNIFHESQLQHDRTREFEISLIRFCGTTSSSDCCIPASTLPCKYPFFAVATRRRKRRIDVKAAPKAAKLPKTTIDENESEGVSRTVVPLYQQHHIPLASLDNLRSRAK